MRDGRPRGPLDATRTRSGRFDDPRRWYGVIYAAPELDGALIEALGRDLTTRVLQVAGLQTRHLAQLAPRRPLRLVDVTGKVLPSLGADGRLSAGDDYAVTQAWSRAFYNHPQRPDGLIFLCRHDPTERAVAIYSRARRTVRSSDAGALLGNSPTVSLDVLQRLARYGFKLDSPSIAFARA